MERIELAGQEDAALVVAMALQAREASDLLDVLLLAGCSGQEARALILSEVN